ncbi:hypothetical protein [Moraxella lacunata]
MGFVLCRDILMSHSGFPSCCEIKSPYFSMILGVVLGFVYGCFLDRCG